LFGFPGIKEVKVINSRGCVFLKEQQQQQNQNKTRERERGEKKFNGISDSAV
jgi:hypothetical protein